MKMTKAANGRAWEPIKLYHHKTDGGAEYLSDKFIRCPNGHKEGIFEGATYVVRLDGQPELTVRPNAKLLRDNAALLHNSKHLLAEMCAAMDDVPAGVDAWMANLRAAIAQSSEVVS